MIENMRLPSSASFLISEDCNLACTYCFELEGRGKIHMSKEVARRGVDFLSDNAVTNGDGEFHILFFGGEPLLKPEIIEEIFKYGLEVSERKGVGFSSSIITNATIMNDEIERIMREYKDKVHLTVQLSVDGIKEVHDKYRITRSGKGSFDTIEKNVPIWKDIFSDNIHALSVHGCSNHDTLPYLFENYNLFRNTWGIPAVWFLPIQSDEWVESDLEVYEKELNKIYDDIIDKIKADGVINEAYNYAPISRCFMPDMFSDKPCGAGSSFVTITALGEIFPCHQFYFNDPDKTTKLGSIFTEMDEFKRIMFSRYDNDDLSCSKLHPECDAYQCYRCPAEGWDNNGSILSIAGCSGIRCKMSKIERKIQLRMREELKQMGLLDNNNNNDENMELENGCSCGECSCNNEDNEVLAMALKLILEKVDMIEKEQALILKKLL